MSKHVEQTFESALGDLLELSKAQREAALEQIGRSDAALRARLESVLALGESRTGELLTPPESGLAPPIPDLEQDPLIGASFDGYTLVGLVGAGGSGRVYEAMQASPGRRVALKVLQGTLVSTAQVKRFREEAQVLGGLQHPGICGLISSGNATIRGYSLPYLVMEFVEGLPLTQAAIGLSLDTKLSLMIRVCEAVEHAHRKGIIHRDLKPANVLVELPADEQPRPRVVDFGLAKLVGEHQQTLTRDANAIMGTIQYMSPERLVTSGMQAAVPDTRWDVYALGVMLFEVLAGRRPFECGSDSASVAAILRSGDSPSLAGVLPGVHADLNLIVAKAMARDINQRYASVASLAEDLRAHLAHRPISAHPPSMLYRAQKFVRRERGLTLGVGLALLAIIGGTIGTVIGLRRAVDSRNHAHAALDVSRVNEYIAKIQSASAQLRNSDAWQARQSLEAAPEEFRGLEWRLLHSECEQSVRQIPLPGPPDAHGYPSLASSPDGQRLAYARGTSLSMIDQKTGAARTAVLDIGPKASVRCLLWSKHHGTLYGCVADEQTTLIVIDPSSLAVVKRVEVDARAGAFGLSFDVEERQIVIGGGRFSDPRPRGYIQVRDAQTLELLFQDDARHFGTRALPTALPNTLVTLSNDDRVELFNWKTRHATQLSIPTDGGGQGRNGFAVSPDGSLFAVGSMLGTQVWSVSPLRQVIGFGATPGVSWHRLVFGPNNDTLFSFQNAGMIGWNINTGATIARAIVKSSGFCKTLAIAPDGREVFAVHDNTIRVMRTDAIGGASMIRAREGSALSPDFSTLARLSLPPDAAGMVTISLADPITGATLSTPDLLPPGCHAKHAVWSPDGVLLAIEFRSFETGLDGLSVFNTKTGVRREVTGSGRVFGGAVFSADSQRIAFKTSPNQWKIAGAHTLDALMERTEDASTHINNLSFSPDGQSIAVGLQLTTRAVQDGADPIPIVGLVALRRSVDGAAIGELRFDEYSQEWIHAYFSPDGRWIAVHFVQDVVLVDALTRQVTSTASLRTDIHGLAWCADSTRLLAGCGEGTMRILGILNQRAPDDSELSPHLVELLSLRGDSWMKRPFASSDGTRVGCVTVYPANRCFVWDTRPPSQRTVQGE